MLLNDKQRNFIELCYKEFGDIKEITRAQLVKVEKKHKVSFPQWLVSNKDLKLKKGLFKMPSGSDTDVEKPNTMEKVVKPTTEKEAAYIVSTLTDNVVPNKDKNFVSFGNYPDVKSIIKSNRFYPVFITGLSGNGKTLMVEQVHAAMKKDLIRVNITIETDEDDLLGGFRLVNGETKFVPGPIIEAMEKGCTLLLDECDLGSNKLMCLQPVLEGKGVYLKKVNKWVTPKAGFNIIATANTKGKGSEDGRFIGTNVLNEAFLERFAVTIEQPYASKKVEEKIIIGSMDKYGKTDKKFATNLCTWAEVIRKTFYDGGVDEIISTRRLDHIVKAYSIFGDKMKAIELCVARFDDDTKESFLNLYSKIDAGVTVDSLNADDQTKVEEDEKEEEIDTAI